MKSRRSSLPALPCCCGEVCPCHQPPKETTKDVILAIITFMVGVSPIFLFAFWVGYMQRQHPIYPTLNIKGEICQIHLIVDGGASHYQLVCPSGVYQ